MASSSSSSRTCEAKYHVFLSFRGEDTRNNFISHLYEDLHNRKGVETFLDCYDVKKGAKISESLLNAIEQSKIAIIVFSKGYASSTWCLEELANIMDRKESGGLTVLPVFYHVDPSDVRKQSRTFGEAFASHEERFEEELGKVQKWRSALTEAANLSGFDAEVISPETKLVEEIVTRVLEILNHGSTINNNHLVGGESRIKEIEDLLDLKSDDVFTVGIHGIGGIGKTALASAVFEKIKSQFDSAYFQINVTEESKKIGLSEMCEELVKKILNDKGANSKSTFTQERLKLKKVLLVLDDVTRTEHKRELIGDLYPHFRSGSRIIITSREKQAIQYFVENEDKIYNVQPLSDIEGLVLFSRWAFEKECPAQGYEQLSEMIVSDTIVKGVPLALKIFGSMLYGMKKPEWESAINELGGGSIKDVMDVLKLSYNRLSDDEKDIFLDIACFYKGFKQTNLKEVLKINGFNSDLGVSKLIKKSLITVINYDEISMHDLLQEMGRKIGQSSRLQSHDYIDDVLRNNMGSPEIQIIQWDISKISQKIKLEPDTFLKMPNLRSIDFFPSPNGDFWMPWKWRQSLHEESKKEVLICEDLDFACSRLRWLRWFKYPLKSLPSRFHPKNLVVLIMPCSNIEQLGNDDQHFFKLKHIDLSHSKQLTKIEHLSPCLETLILESCSSLTELPTSLQSKSLGKVILSGTAIEKLPFIESSKLHTLELENCSRLEGLPSTICHLSRLERLFLSGCSKLERLPIDIGNMKKLWIIRANGIAMRELPRSIKQLDDLVSLSLRGCKGQELLDSSLSLLSGLKSLKDLDLSYCQITKLPNSFGQLSVLEALNLSENEFECVPANIFKGLPKLASLHVSNCKRLQSLSMLPCVLELQAHDCTALESLPDLSLYCARLRYGELILNFANCFQLDRNALKAEIQNALLELQSKAPKIFSIGTTSIVYPGNEIPEFFSSQEMGSSITLDLPPDCLKTTRLFVRFIACVVLTFEDDHIIHKSLNVRYECTIEGKHGKTRHWLRHFYDHPRSYGVFQSWTIKSSDHVFLGYSNFSSLELTGKERVTFDFSVDGCEDIHVKKCIC